MYALGRPSKTLWLRQAGALRTRCEDETNYCLPPIPADSAPGCFVRFREANQDTRMTGLAQISHDLSWPIAEWQLCAIGISKADIHACIASWQLSIRYGHCSRAIECRGST
jgi:hypothetical protein